MNKKLLIVEDHENISELVIAIFSDLKDYSILRAKDGKEALDMVKKHNPDIVLLDIQLPEMDGYSVCNSIKRNTTLSHTRVLMLSSQGQNFDFKKSKEVGADGYIVKPFVPADLVEKVERYFEQ